MGGGGGECLTVLGREGEDEEAHLNWLNYLLGGYGGGVIKGRS